MARSLSPIAAEKAPTRASARRTSSAAHGASARRRRPVSPITPSIKRVIRRRTSSRALRGASSRGCARAEFIPVAEEIGLIVPLGEWVLRKACADAATWPPDIKIAVNLSPIQVMNQNLVSVVVSALAASGLPANRLELEITESVLMQNTENTLAALHRLRELGVRISMDDFGTGYSSLSYLRSFPFDKIKIDRCFISGLADGDDSVAIVLAIAGLAKNLGIMTTAEGVETQAQLQQVRALGCTEMQGFLFSPPRRLEDIVKLFQARQRPAEELVRQSA